MEEQHDSSLENTDDLTPHQPKNPDNKTKEEKCLVCGSKGTCKLHYLESGFFLTFRQLLNNLFLKDL